MKPDGFKNPYLHGQKLADESHMDAFESIVRSLERKVSVIKETFTEDPDNYLHGLYQHLQARRIEMNSAQDHTSSSPQPTKEKEKQLPNAYSNITGEEEIDVVNMSLGDESDMDAFESIVRSLERKVSVIKETFTEDPDNYLHGLYQHLQARRIEMNSAQDHTSSSPQPTKEKEKQLPNAYSNITGEEEIDVVNMSLGDESDMDAFESIVRSLERKVSVIKETFTEDPDNYLHGLYQHLQARRTEMNSAQDHTSSSPQPTKEKEKQLPNAYSIITGEEEIDVVNMSLGDESDMDAFESIVRSLERKVSVIKETFTEDPDNYLHGLYQHLQARRTEMNSAQDHTSSSPQPGEVKEQLSNAYSNNTDEEEIDVVNMSNESTRSNFYYPEVDSAQARTPHADDGHHDSLTCESDLLSLESSFSNQSEQLLPILGLTATNSIDIPSLLVDGSIDFYDDRVFLPLRVSTPKPREVNKEQSFDSYGTSTTEDPEVDSARARTPHADDGHHDSLTWESDLLNLESSTFPNQSEQLLPILGLTATNSIDIPSSLVDGSIDFYDDRVFLPLRVSTPKPREVNKEQSFDSYGTSTTEDPEVNSARARTPHADDGHHDSLTWESDLLNLESSTFPNQSEQLLPILGLTATNSIDIPSSLVDGSIDFYDDRVFLPLRVSTPKTREVNKEQSFDSYGVISDKEEVDGVNLSNGTRNLSKTIYSESFNGGRSTDRLDYTNDSVEYIFPQSPSHHPSVEDQQQLTSYSPVPLHSCQMASRLAQDASLRAIAPEDGHGHHSSQSEATSSNNSSPFNVKNEETARSLLPLSTATSAVLPIWRPAVFCHQRVQRAPLPLNQIIPMEISTERPLSVSSGSHSQMTHIPLPENSVSDVVPALHQDPLTGASTGLNIYNPATASCVYEPVRTFSEVLAELPSVLHQDVLLGASCSRNIFTGAPSCVASDSPITSMFPRSRIISFRRRRPTSSCGFLRARPAPYLLPKAGQ